MQKPINSSERSSAFWKFFVFFVMAVVMIIVAVYFNFRLPHKENEILKAKAESMRLQNMEQEKITNSFLDTKKFIDSIDKPGVNIKYISDMVAQKLGDLNKLQVSDSSIQGKMNRVVTNVFFEYNALKSKTTNVVESQTQVAELLSKNASLLKDLEQAKRDLDFCRGSNSAGR
jgi:Type VI secretion system, TssO